MSIIPTKIFNPRNTTDYITASQLAKFFSIEPRQLNQILTNMNWIEKKHYVWWIATALGKQHGAIEHTCDKNRVCYVNWDKKIMHNEELTATIKSTVRSYIENNLYEEFIKEQFTTQGYTVWHHSKEKTQQDKNKNITLIAKKNKKILLIHCRDNQLDISVEELKIFQKQRDDFKKENPVFENYDLSLHYSMSGFFLTEEAYEYVEDNRGDITYEVVKGNSENNWMDSLLLKERMFNYNN
ncbi:MAG: Unknown protein [uncultured Sulfurovum sp.]|uniref:Restriction endonuclease type IV Mrr domain-containing protein n=1 Tax=uncultured Sulfurovum sp. TaxID=269237 RepID=A0A6S6T6J2_9BACT|nr:MAG: Unknown protein [uncultured Sulfurovum sp.]